MTVNDLRVKLSGFDGNMRIVVSNEAETSSHLFEIDDVSAHRGTPVRLEDGEAGFTYGNQGPAEWVFIGVHAA
jgi:hypothetical protein